ncbi:hypothetical protein M0R19_00030 [Candidatus Pacearchaeota archaeon]|jgi:hypothetical protein|nr:hypothetical protein [Candidatus Pacearchaeota archaeon]
MKQDRWEIFEAGTRSSEAKITFTKTRYIRFNSEFIRKNNLKDRSYVRVYIKEDDEKFFIGFEFLKIKEDKTLKLGKSGRSDLMYCSGNSLFSRINLNVKKMEKSMNFFPMEEKLEDRRLFTIKVLKS